MRILYLHQYFNTPGMAGGTRSFEMARRFVEAGHVVDMITSDRDGKRIQKAGRWAQTTEAGINVHWCHVPYSNQMTYKARLRAFGLFALMAYRRASKLPADVVFATSTPLTIALPGIALAHHHSVPMVLEVRDLWPEMPIAMGALRSSLSVFAARRLERLAYSRARHVVALSPGMHDGVVRAGVECGRVTVIPNSCDSQLFDVPASVGQSFRSRFPWLGNRPLVLYAGTFGAVNGACYIVEIADAMQRIAPEVRFLLVGDGKEKGLVRKLAETTGVLGSSLFMLDSLPKSEMPACFSAADVSMSVVRNIPEAWVNSANKFFDSLAARRPIMINYGGWQAELLKRTGAGIVVPPEAPEAAATALAAFIRNKPQQTRARAAAGQLACHEFSRERLADQLIAVLEQAANGH